MSDQDRNPLEREALRWFAIARDDAVTDEDRAACERWKRQSDEHLAAWMRAEALWQAFAPVETELKDTRRAGFTRRAVLGSCAALLFAGPAAYWLLRDGAFADFNTEPGERRGFALSDGSVMELGGRSSATLDYSESRRRLILHRGEAHFTVASDPGRPFTVAAGDGETKALGTRFNIHMDDDVTTVTVAEHSVEIALSGRQNETLEAGWQVEYSREAISRPVKADLAAIEAWRKGRLVYHGVALSRVLNDIERQRGGIIVLTDGQLADVPISAAFDTDSADAALDTIANMLPLRVVRAGGLVVLYAS